MKNKVLKILNPGQINEVLELIKDGEEKNLKVIVNATSGGKYDLDLKSVHVGKNTKAKVEVRGVVANGSEVRVKGLVKIGKEARGTDSFLAMKLLLLDKSSFAVAEPELEIENNLVKASHSASVGKIDEEQMYFLSSRGISRKEAELLIVKGFLDE